MSDTLRGIHTYKAETCIEETLRTNCNNLKVSDICAIRISYTVSVL